MMGPCRRILLSFTLPVLALAASADDHTGGTAGRFRSDSSMVLVPVTVTDPIGRPVLTLASENFQVTEDDHVRAVRYFGKEEAPLSVAVVLDWSESMANQTGKIREAMERFMAAANPEDEFCLVELRDRAELVRPFGASAAEVLNLTKTAEAAGHTALLDGMYLALNQMRKARFARKALFVISDGGDNHSRFRTREVRDLALESDTAIYAVELRRYTNMWVPEGSGILEALAAQSGGRDYVVESEREIADAAERIGWELRSQYLLGFIPSGLTSDGKYHRLRVQVMQPTGQPKLSAYWRRGYYAPQR